MSDGRLILRGDLGIDARLQFMTEASAAIESASTGGAEVQLDCSLVESVEAVDVAVIGMLVAIARASSRRGARVGLVRASEPMRAQLEAAGVAHFFNFRS
jgi:anti-anti-sigma regulatory factor